MAEHVAQNPRLARLEPLLGTWSVTVTIGGQTMGAGTAVFEWVEGGAFLRERVDPGDPSFPSATLMIGADDSSEQYMALYCDSRGVARVYLMRLEQGQWRMWRDAPGFAQRFSGSFEDGGNTIAARWEKSLDGSTWEHDFDLTYTRPG